MLSVIIILSPPLVPPEAALDAMLKQHAIQLMKLELRKAGSTFARNIRTPIICTEISTAVVKLESRKVGPTLART